MHWRHGNLQDHPYNLVHELRDTWRLADVECPKKKPVCSGRRRHVGVWIATTAQNARRVQVERGMNLLQSHFNMSGALLTYIAHILTDLIQ